MYAAPTYLEFIFQGEYTPPDFADIIFADPSRPAAVISVAGKHGSFQGIGRHELAHTAVGTFQGKRGSFQGFGQHLGWPPYLATGAFVGKRGTMAASAFITLPLVSNPVGLHWTPPQAAEHALLQGWNGRQAAGRQAPRWGAGQQAQQAIHLDTGPAIAAEGRRPIRWGTSSITARAADVAYSAAAPMRVATRPIYGLAALRAHGAPGAWDAAIPVRWKILSRWSPATGQAGTVRLRQTAAQVARQAWRVPWGAARWPALIWPPVVVVIPPLVDPTQYLPPAYCEFLFRTLYTPPGYTEILFGRHRSPVWGGALLVMTTSIQVVRLPDRQPIDALSISIDTDWDSWSSSFSLRLGTLASYNLLTLSLPTPVEITINGWAWQALIEQGDTRQAGLDRSYSVSGRSLAADLDEPNRRPRNRSPNESALLAQQAALAELVGTDFEGNLDWGVADWLLPIGAWHYSAQTPIKAIASLVEAVDGIMIAHRSQARLRVRPRYSVVPWGYAAATVDHVLQTLYSVNARRGIAQAGYDGIIVTGRDHGVVLQATRAGTPGTTLGETIEHPLLTTLAANTERATAALSKGWPRARIAVEVPLRSPPDQPGLVLPGDLVEVISPYEVRRGVVTAVRVEAQISRVRQTVEVEYA